jgi:hypothetical protein
MAKTTPKTRSKRAKTPKRPRGKPLVEVFAEAGSAFKRAGLYPPKHVQEHVEFVAAVRWLLELLAVDAGSLEADVHGAIARVQELLP